MKPVDLSGRVALVTGSSRGIGRMSALYLAEAGCDIVVNYNTDKESGERTCAEIRGRALPDDDVSVAVIRRI